MSSQALAAAEIDVELSGQEGAEISLVGEVSKDGSSIRLRPEVPLAWGESYELCATSGSLGVARLVELIAPNCSLFTTTTKLKPAGIETASILVALGSDSPYGRFYGPILHAEGFNTFRVSMVSDLTSEDFAGRSVILLDSTELPETLLPAVRNWVAAGGLLITIRAGKTLRAELGVSKVSEGISRHGILLINSGHRATAGLSTDPLQLHGPIERFTLDVDVDFASHGLAGLLDMADGEKVYQPISIRRQGRGHVVTFGFDVARSIVLTRQGNPMWINQERDGSDPLRPSDLFYPDFVDLDKAHVPAADELQRLLANVIVEMAPHPMPRFWYLPEGRRAVVVMAGDDHGFLGGTKALFEKLDELSPEGCRLDRWECLRASVYLSPWVTFSPEDASRYASKGFELGVHVDTGCKSPKDRHGLRKVIREQIDGFRNKYPGLPEQKTHRIHCLAWSGWIDVPVVEREYGIRLDLNYYNWPPKWFAGRRVFLTGSGFPMPYADYDGSPLDIYQAASHLVNEDGIPHREGVELLLDRALGPEQYFGAFGTHFDFTDGYSDILIQEAMKRDVALITSQQLLSWVDARSASRFYELEWADDVLHFELLVKPGAEYASGMLPVTFRGKNLADISCDGTNIPWEQQSIKGIETAFFNAIGGTCAANYL